MRGKSRKGRLVQNKPSSVCVLNGQPYTELCYYSGFGFVTLVMPWTVMQELDRFKHGRKSAIYDQVVTS